MVAAYPTRGLDVRAVEFIHRVILAQRSRGVAILMISEDLDEIFNLADRIVVLYEGRIMETVPSKEADIQKIGLLMAGVSHEGGKNS
jgi:simple sugar transport system ATP-binding protein